MASVIFISTAHEDLIGARALRDGLLDHQVECFLYDDSIQGGRNWIEAIEEALRNATAFVPIASRPYFDSPWCRHELDMALRRNAVGSCQILPVHPEGERILDQSILGNFQGIPWQLNASVTDVAQGIVAALSPERDVGQGVPLVARPRTPAGPMQYGHPTFPDHDQVGLIGTGGFADVYSAVRVSNGRPEALKVLRSALRRVPAFRRRFIGGAERQQGLRHDHIAQVFDIDPEAGMYSMEYLDMGDLERWMLAQPLAIELLIGTFTKVCSAVSYAHSLGILHRDIKPANILLGADGAVKLTDFDLACDAEGSRYTQTAAGAGSLPFLAPEVVADPHRYGIASEVYSLGVTLFYLLTGRLVILASMDRSDISEAIGEVGRPEWSGPVLRAVTRKPAARYSSVEELDGDIQETLAASSRRRSGLQLATAVPQAPDGLQAMEAKAALSDLAAWNDASPRRQDGAIRVVGQLLGPAFVPLPARRYNCAGRSCRVGRFQCTQTGIVLHLIPGGTVEMGLRDPDAEYRWCVAHYPNWERRYHDRETPVRRASLPPFLMGRSPVLQRQWDQIKETYGLRDKRSWRSPDVPLERVSWDDLQPFLAATGYELPSEAQWEYACRAGSTTRFFWGGEMEASYCWYRDNSNGRPQAASLNPERSNAFGLLDMLGNVWEWCADAWHDTYQGAPTSHEPWTDGTSWYAAQRGGGWNNHEPSCRSSFRSFWAREDRLDNTGFRVVRSVEFDGKLQGAMCHAAEA